MIGDNERRQMVLVNEGQLLQQAAFHGTDGAAQLSRCVIDGAFNALIRLEGKEEAAKYAFALVDRVVGGIKDPTPWPPVAIEAEPAPVPVVPSAPPRSPIWAILAAAFAGCMPR